MCVTGLLTTDPFTEDRGRETAIRGETAGSLLAAVKGAPEVVLSLTTLTAEGQTLWQARVVELAAAGHKVIACAWREMDPTAWPGGELDRDLTFAGLLACADPVRAGVAEAIQHCRQAGIHVLMVTDDHPETARAVAREIGLGGGNPTVLSADALDALLAPQRRCGGWRLAHRSTTRLDMAHSERQRNGHGRPTCVNIALVRYMPRSLSSPIAR